MMRTAILLVLSSTAFAQNVDHAQDVDQWSRFERAVENGKPYSAPYRDVTLQAAFTGPDGKTTGVQGFYDGGKTWKVRFMPDLVGAWKYSAKFSDGTPGMEGTFRCVRSKIRGMLSIEPENPIWFGFRGGAHGQIRSLHVGDRFFAENWPTEKRKAFLDWAQTQGYNMLSIASHYLNRDDAGRGRSWKTPDLWPLNAVEYQKMERILDDLAGRGFTVFPFAGFFGQKSDYPRNPAEQEHYIRYTLARLGSYWNIMLNVAGPEPNVGKSWMTDADVQRLGRMIRKLDVYQHPLSVHNRTGDDPYRDSDWTTYGTLQGPKTVNRKKLSQGLLASHHSAKPLYAQETLWAGNKFHKESYTEVDLRKNAYVLIMSASAINFGDMSGDSSSGFSGTLEMNELVQNRHDIMKRVWDYFDTLPFWRLRPRQDLVSTGFCLAEEGAMYLVYLEKPAAVDVVVKNGPYNVRWVNAQNTRDVRNEADTNDGKGLQPPTGGDDWILELRAAKPAAR